MIVTIHTLMPVGVIKEIIPSNILTEMAKVTEAAEEERYYTEMQKQSQHLQQLMGSALNVHDKLLEQEAEIEVAVKITILENRRKHCKNYLETKQIDRELNKLKFRKGRINDGNKKKHKMVQEK